MYIGKKTLVVCIFSLLAANTLSLGEELNHETLPDIRIEIIPFDILVDDMSLDDNPVVVITYPENGTILTTDYLEVLGYAYDPDGMDYWQYLYEYVYGTLIKSENLSGKTSYSFRIQIFDIPPGPQKVTVTFCDIFNFCGSDSVTAFYGENNAPQTPTKPNGPEVGAINIAYTFVTSSSDPNGDDISYGWDWNNDNSVDEWTGFYHSGEPVQTLHTWSTLGTYKFKVKAKDTHGDQSSFSPTATILITANNPPNKPNIPNGRLSGTTGKSYSYSSSTIDPEGQRIYYMFDWDDGSTLEWEGPYVSGDVFSSSHVWQVRGTFQVKVKAKDDPNGDGDLSDGVESVWSDPLSVIMAKSKAINTPLFLQKIFQRFPFFEKILN